MRSATNTVSNGPSRTLLRGPPRLYAARFPPELLRFRPTLVRSWERIARLRALGSQPPPPAPEHRQSELHFRAGGPPISPQPAKHGKVANFCRRATAT